MANRRKTVVINKPFQYQYALLIVSAAVLLTNIALMALRFYPSEPLLLTTPIALLISVFELAMIVGVWYAGIKISHRIAGPVYVFARELGKLAEGDLSARIALRKKDQFLDAAEQMNDSLATIEARIIEIKTIAGQLNHADVSEESKELLVLLEDRLSYFSVGE